MLNNISYCFSFYYYLTTSKAPTIISATYSAQSRCSLNMCQLNKWKVEKRRVMYWWADRNVLTKCEVYKDPQPKKDVMKILLHLSTVLLRKDLPPRSWGIEPVREEERISPLWLWWKFSSTNPNSLFRESVFTKNLLRISLFLRKHDTRKLVLAACYLARFMGLVTTINKRFYFLF